MVLFLFLWFCVYLNSSQIFLKNSINILVVIVVRLHALSTYILNIDSESPSWFKVKELWGLSYWSVIGSSSFARKNDTKGQP